MTSLMERIKQEHQSIAMEVAQIQQNAQNSLKKMNENRLEMAEKQGMELQEFRQDLQEKTSDFLIMTNGNRQEMSEKQGRELQQFHQELQQKTADFLTVTNLIRQESSYQQTIELQQFRQDLQHKTELFLTETRLNREEMSEKQAMNLQKFRQSLIYSIWGGLGEVEMKTKPEIKVQKNKVLPKKQGDIPQILTEDSWLLPGDIEDENAGKETGAKKLVSRRLSSKDTPVE